MAKQPRMYTEKEVLALKARLYNAAAKERNSTANEWYQRGIEEGRKQLQGEIKTLLGLPYEG